MVDLKLQVPVTDKVEVDSETLAAIDRGIKDADEGRTVPLEEVRSMIPKWISKFGSQKLAYSWSRFPSTAERFGNDILNHLELLRSFPYIGRPVDDRKDVRQLVHTPIVIYYRVNEHPNVIEVLHFWHGARRNPFPRN